MALHWIEEYGENREVGEKAASLHTASKAGLDVPRGFVVPSSTFEQFVRENNLERRIQRVLEKAERTDPGSLRDASDNIRSLIMDADLGEDTVEEVEEAYENINMSEEVRNASEEAVDLVGGQRETEFVAVRSSPVGARVPGVHRTELNVNGKEALLEEIKKCWASLYSAEALATRELGEPQSMAVIVQRMVEADSSGAAFSSHPLGTPGKLIESVLGLGSALSAGTATPDVIHLDRRGDIEEERIAEKQSKIVRDPTSGKNLKKRVKGDEKQARSLERSQISDVVEAVKRLRREMGGNIQVDFAFDRTGLHILDITGFEPAEPGEEGGDSTLDGIGAAPGTASGTARPVYTDTDIDELQEQDIAVSVEASTSLTTALNRINGAITDHGGTSSNLAALARRFETPLVTGTGEGTDMLHDGQDITVNGFAGTVSEGGRRNDTGETVPTDPARAEGAAAMTATQVKVVNAVSPNAEGAVISDYIGPDKAEQVAREYHPHQVWVRTDRRNDSDGNLGILSDDSGQGDGVVLESYGNVMRVPDLVEDGIRFLGMDLDALQQEGGEEALMNSVEKLGEETVDQETAVILQDLNHRHIEKVVEAGIDTVAVPEGKVQKARQAVARAERKFILDRLREV